MESEDKEKLITVFKTGHHGTIAVIKSILDEAGLEYSVKGEGIQDLIGAGVFGVGFNPITGPVEFQVLEDNVEYAKELLKDVSDTPPETEEET
ncbi:MAG: DUF2007 domain-containing protein [Ignavibacteriae bacterium]|nr:DUF2007 domain-containing protein [Ignavibacteriota bacterium]